MIEVVPLILLVKKASEILAFTSIKKLTSVTGGERNATIQLSKQTARIPVNCCGFIYTSLRNLHLPVANIDTYFQEALKWHPLQCFSYGLACT